MTDNVPPPTPTPPASPPPAAADAASIVPPAASVPPETATPPAAADSLEAIYNVPVQISVVLGHTMMPVSHLLKLGRGSILELDRKVGEAVDIYVNDRLVARGEVVVVDEHLGITLTEMVKMDFKKI